MLRRLCRRYATFSAMPPPLRLIIRYAPLYMPRQRLRQPLDATMMLLLSRFLPLIDA